MRRLIYLVPFVLLVSACSGGMPGGAAPAPPTLDPVGVYDCMLDVDGMDFGATLSISGTPGAYTGSVESEMGNMPVSDIQIEGTGMTFVVDSPDMTVFFAVAFDGNRFTGEFDAGDMGGFISGTKR